MVKAFAEALHLAVEFFFAGMGEGGMADVVYQRQGFGEILVERQHAGGGPGDLGDLDRMGEAIAKVVAEARSEDLVISDN